jgi:hypothetical protein
LLRNNPQWIGHVATKTANAVGDWRSRPSERVAISAYTLRKSRYRLTKASSSGRVNAGLHGRNRAPIQVGAARYSLAACRCTLRAPQRRGADAGRWEPRRAGCGFLAKTSWHNTCANGLRNNRMGSS